MLGQRRELLRLQLDPVLAQQIGCLVGAEGEIRAPDPGHLAAQLVAVER
ncbi:hypothetical protein [Blastococcus sp. TF02A-30]|nr:hypothetical protein [Blastococcus sp. TF02A-30]